MRVARLRIQRFRGFEKEVFTFKGAVVLAGEPRAGRTDVVEALRRVLDPRSTSGRVNPLDIHRPADQDVLTEVEVSLLDLGPALTSHLDEYLEVLDSKTGEPAVAGAKTTELGVRFCYRARYDADTDTGEHWVDAAGLSDASAGFAKRIRRADREALPVMFIDAAAPLQVRAEGAFRQLLEDADPVALDTALEDLDQGIAQATSAFAQTTVVSAGLTDILAAGPTTLLGLTDPADVGFVPDDGSLATLLRALQPALTMDAAGMLPLTSHGSTTRGILQVAEAVAVAGKSNGGLIVIGDDFGDGLDASASEHTARLLRAAASQTILTTRRPDVIRAFDQNLIRLTRSHGQRRHHALAVTNKAGRFAQTLVLDRLLGAVTSRTVVLVEGPFDVDGYGTLAGRLAGSDTALSFAAHGMCLVSPPGSDGGITRLPALAKLAKELGFHVRAIVDNDTPGVIGQHVSELVAEAEAVVVLPDRTAVEGALVSGLQLATLRKAYDLLVESGELLDPPVLTDSKISEYLVRDKALKKQRLHSAWARAVGKRPPIATEAIRLACSDETGLLEVPSS